MSILETFWKVIAPFQNQGPTLFSDEPRTLSRELLTDVTGACELPNVAEPKGRRECWRVPIGTRATLCLPDAHSTPISLVVRDVSAIGAGLLFEKPMKVGKKFWLYLPKPHAPEEHVGICCVVIRCDPGGAFKKLYSVGVTFLEGSAPPLVFPEVSHERPLTIEPNRIEEEGGWSPTRSSHSLFLPTSRPTPEPEMMGTAIVTPATVSAAPLSAAGERAAKSEEPWATAASIQSPPVEVVSLNAASVEHASSEAAPVEIAPIEAAPVEAVKIEPAFIAPIAVTEPTATDAPKMYPKLTPTQRQRIAKEMKQQLAYLNRLIKRLEEMQLDSADPVLSQTRQAKDATARLLEQFSTHAPRATKPSRKRQAKRASRRKSHEAAQAETPARNLCPNLNGELGVLLAESQKQTAFTLDTAIHSAVKGVSCFIPRRSLELAEACN